MSSLPGELQFRSIENGSRSMRLIQINLEPDMLSHAAARRARTRAWGGEPSLRREVLPP